MITVKFKLAHGVIHGFEVSGHALSGAAGEDIVCSAVSSAVYLTANAITDVVLLKADVVERDGFMSLELENAADAQVLLKSLKLHLSELAKQYPNNIKVLSIIWRCQNA